MTTLPVTTEEALAIAASDFRIREAIFAAVATSDEFALRRAAAREFNLDSERAACWRDALVRCPPLFLREACAMGAMQLSCLKPEELALAVVTELDDRAAAAQLRTMFRHGLIGADDCVAAPYDACAVAAAVDMRRLEPLRVMMHALGAVRVQGGHRERAAALCATMIRTPRREASPRDGGWATDSEEFRPVTSAAAAFVLVRRLSILILYDLVSTVQELEDDEDGSVPLEGADAVSMEAAAELCRIRRRPLPVHTQLAHECQARAGWLRRGDGATPEEDAVAAAAAEEGAVLRALARAGQRLFSGPSEPAAGAALYTTVLHVYAYSECLRDLEKAQVLLADAEDRLRASPEAWALVKTGGSPPRHEYFPSVDSPLGVEGVDEEGMAEELLLFAGSSYGSALRAGYSLAPVVDDSNFMEYAPLIVRTAAALPEANRHAMLYGWLMHGAPRRGVELALSLGLPAHAGGGTLLVGAARARESDAGALAVLLSPAHLVGFLRSDAASGSRPINVALEYATTRGLHAAVLALSHAGAILQQR